MSFTLPLLCLLASFFGIALLGDPQANATLFLILYGGSFFFWGLCVYAIRTLEENSLANALLSACIVAGMIAGLLLFTKTTISTDIYRYIWDGGLTLHGINPYLVTPENVSLPALRGSGLFAMLDWKDQYTVYPPLAQLISACGYTLYSTFGIVAAKALFASGALVAWWFFYRLVQPRIFILALLNPMLLFEAYNGGHFDVFVVAALLGVWYFFRKERYYLSSILLAGAILIKLYPLLFLPLFGAELFRRRGWFASVRYSALCLGIVGMFYVPLLPHLLFLFNRYHAWVQEMMFNASAYNLLLHFYSSFTVEPALWALRTSTLLLILAAGFLARRALSPATLLLASLVFLISSSVVYPWYALIALPFVFLLSEKETSFRYPLLYSLALMQFLVSMTYINEILSIPFEIRARLLSGVAVVEYGVLVALLLCALALSRHWIKSSSLKASTNIG